MADTELETLEDRVTRLEAIVAAQEQRINYLQERNHGLESAVAASSALLLSVTSAAVPPHVLAEPGTEGEFSS